MLGGDGRERVKQVAGGSRQPVKPRHRQHVAGVELVEQPAQLRAVGLRAARHFAEHLFAPGLGELAHLSVNALTVRRYPRIAVFHALLMTVIYAKQKPFWIKAVILFHNSRILNTAREVPGATGLY